MTGVDSSYVASAALLGWLRNARVGVASPDPRDGAISLTYSTRYRVSVFVLFILSSAMLLAIVPF